MVVLSTLKEMIEPYIPECRYLKDVEFDFPGITGKFEIPRPFYCIETGHFNVVEAMICYNQLAYTMFAEAFQQGLIDSVGIIPLEDYKELQAGDSYIARINNLRFRKPINPKSFSGSINLVRTMKRNGTSFFSTEFEFKDSNDGNVSGEALLAVSFSRLEQKVQRLILPENKENTIYVA